MSAFVESLGTAAAPVLDADPVLRHTVGLSSIASITPPAWRRRWRRARVVPESGQNHGSDTGSTA